ncbi:MAG: class SAM-dependent rRNA methyltransferase [Bacteriovoracaceae bacterium]|nr:class SAM-dependent rRNA methyltransferase [Bacteriovoracaceae bacterium]
MDAAKIFLKKGRAGPTYGRHPWVFSNYIERVEGAPQDGADVAVYGDRGDFLAWGIFNSKSDIRARLYSWTEKEVLSKEFIFEKIREAIELRRKVLKFDQADGAVRLIFSEGDGLSGLVVDKYGDYLVVQITSLALFKREFQVIEALVEYARPKGIFFRAEKNILKAEGVAADDGVLWGKIPDEPIEVVENGIKFKVDLRGGQKTGFYTDQRENRMLARNLCEGRRVLDLCTYTGGFALGLAKFGAKEVVGVDASEEAITIAKENAELNGIENISFECKDAFEFLQNETSQFDMIILDPPKFAPSKGSRDKALRAYFRLNLEAIRVLAPKGIFISCSCSHQIGRLDFNSVVASVFKKVGRSGKILFQGSQSPDHPISITCPETQYLKSIFCLAD